jgi:hypothetical protein
MWVFFPPLAQATGKKKLNGWRKPRYARRPRLAFIFFRIKDCY